MTAPSELALEPFLARFGGVFEHSPWIAAAVHRAGLTPREDSAGGLHAAMAAAMRAGTQAQKRALVAAHPDLAGKLAAAGELTPDSTREQAGAGLDRLTPDERTRFTELNEAYKARFGLPFIIAVTGLTKAEILAAFEARLQSTPEVEFETALREVERIALIRLKKLLPS